MENYCGAECVDLIHDVHIALLYVFIDEFEEGSRFEYAKDYGLVFYLIKHLKDDFLELHFRIFWPEVMAALAQFPDFEEMFSDETKEIFREIAEAGVAGYNFIDPLRKLKAINQLVELLHELQLFKNSLGGLFEKQNELSKEKAKVVTEIKDVDAELLKFKSDLENSENNLKLQEEILRNLPRLEMNKKRQEIEDIKRKIYKIQANISKSEAQVVKLRSNFDELKVKAPFLIHPTQLLGKDKDRNLYFFFSDDPVGVYCQQHTDSKGAVSKWTLFDNKDVINTLMDCLNKNAKRECGLYNSLKNLTKDEFILYPESKKVASSSSQIQDELKHEKPEEEELMDKVMEYESIYQPQEEYLKGKGRVNKNLQLLDIFRDKIYNTGLVERATSTFLLNLLLELEQEFTNYLRSRKCRWVDKQTRETLRNDAQENLSESKVAELLIMLNTRFIHIETFLRKDEDANDDGNSENEEQEGFAMKKRKNKLWKAEKEVGDDDDKKGENQFDEEFETDTKNYFIKKKVLKTWGFYNERFKQAWETFVANAETDHIGSLYLGSVIFIEIICRYITRKFMKIEEEVNPNDKDRQEANSGLRNVDRDRNSTDYIFRKRKGGRVQGGFHEENTAVEKFNLRVRSRIDRDRKLESQNREADPYDDIDEYSPDRLKTIRNTRALTKKLSKHG